MNTYSMPVRLARFFQVSFALILFLSTLSIKAADKVLLNVSYDVSRELYKDFNQAFSSHFEAQSGGKITVHQSHGGSTKQAGAVIAGLEADVVTMNQQLDIDQIASAGLIDSGWRDQFPNQSSPYTSTTVFLVRKGNPKNIKDWQDLIKPGVQVVLPNPKTSGNGRYSYLAAYGYALRKFGNNEKANEFIAELFQQHVPILPTGGRAATTSFIQHNTGDVLLTFENEAYLTSQDIGSDKFDIVIPSISIEADHPVAIVDKVVDKNETRKLAEAYLNYLWSDIGQETIAKHRYRPRNQEILSRYKENFPELILLSITEIVPGGWSEAQKIHFSDGGLFDQLYKNR